MADSTLVCFRASLLIAATLLLGACVTSSGASGKEALPDDAIPIGDDAYMVPLSAPVGECRGYRMYSPTKMVTQAVYFRDADGEFVLNSSRCEPWDDAASGISSE